MKNILNTLRLVGTGILALFSVSSALAQDVQTLYANPSPPTWRDNYTGGSGCRFTVGPTNVVVSHLGYFCSNAVSLAQVESSAGLLTSHYVGIYSANPVQLLAQVTVPAGTGADWYTNEFVWMPLDPPFLLQSNTTYYVACLPYSGDGDLWGDSFTATFNGFFVGDTTNSILAPETAYGPGNLVWPVNGFSLFGSNTTYCIEGMANLPVDQARVGVQSTNVFAAAGPLSVVGFASGQQPINYQWWQPGSPPTPVEGQTGPNLTFANATSANSGIYYLTASNSLGGEASPYVFLAVSNLPVGIQVAPTNTSVFNNYPATFSVVITGAPPISVQWYSNNVAIAGATNLDVNGFVFTNSFTFTVQNANNGNVFSVVASNYVNSTAYTVTNSATLTVLPNWGYPQHIMHGPISTNYFYENNQNGSSGDTGNNPSGQCGGKIIMANTVLITHLGYCATGLVLNGYSQLNTSHHISLYDTNGNMLGYVILTNGTPVSGAIDGYLWAPLNPPLLLTNGGTYTVAGENFYETDPWGTTYVPTNWDTYITPGGSVDSAVYVNNAWPAEPTSGGYGSQIYSLPNMGDLVISNEIFSLIAPASVTQAAGTSATLNGYVNGPPPVTVQWYQNGVAMPGQTNITLTLNNLVAGVSSYTLVAMNGTLSATSAVATVTAYASPVIINALPQTYTNIANANLMALYAGANPTFSITALGAGTLSYRWYTNGVLVGGATTASYKFSDVTVTGPTNFYCVVSNDYNSTAYTTTSAVWSASILPNPTNSAGGLAPYPQSVLSLNPIGYWRMNDTNLDGVDLNGPSSGNGDFGEICHDYVGGNDGMYTNCQLGYPGYNSIGDPSDSSAQFGEIDDLGSDFGDSLAFGISGINFATPAGANAAFTVEAWVSGYQQTSDAGIVTLGWGGGGEQFDLDCGSDTAPTSHGFRFFIRSAAGTVYSVSSTVEPATISQGPWYHLVGVVDEISNQNVTFYINGVSVGTTAIPAGSGILAGTNAVLGHLSLMGIGARTAAETGSYSDQFLGNINDVAIYNYALSSNQVLTQYLEGGQVSPYLSPAPPSTITVVAGSPLILPAIAFGTPALGYQWVNENTSTVLASGTGAASSLNASYTNSAVPSNWNGNTLELTVTNAYGTTNVTVALTVTLAPAITTNLPSAVTVNQGNIYTYYFGVVGESPLGYQWYENGSGIPGATNATYTPSTVSGSTNTFYAIVTNTYGSVTSVTSTFSVIAAPTNAIASAILSLNPVGYWPMNEVEPSAPGDIETNYGTLGALGTGYYPDWMTNNVGAIVHGIQGAIASDSDQAVLFMGDAGNGGAIYTNSLYLPHSSPSTTLNPPFTVECWIYPTNGPAGDIWSQSGYEGLNAGGYGGGGGTIGGIRLYGGGTGMNVYSYYNSSSLQGPISFSVGLKVWTHVVVTCDSHTNITVYTNGIAATASTPYVGLYTPDYWTPFEVCNGRGNTRAVPCGVDELAIYNSALSAATILNDYQTGTNSSPATAYFNTVLNNHPLVYWRMDSPTYVAPPANTWPTLYGYGSGALNGVYNPGTLIGVLPGPNSNGVAWAGVPANVPAMSGVSSFGDVPYSAAYNLTNVDQPFSAIVTFRCNPADNRYQCIVGRGDGSWRFAISGNDANSTPGGLQFAMGAGNGSPTSEIYPGSTTLNCNDGNWHQAVGVFQPASNPNLPSTIFLYVDGQLSVIDTLSTTNNIAGTTYDLLMGAAPDYTNNVAGVGRQFDGQLCNVALFTNALTAAQVQALYDAAYPAVAQQPLAIKYQLPLPNTNISTLYAGASPSFSVTLDTAVQSFNAPAQSYQWYTNNVAVGYGTNATLTLANVQPGFITNYCIAANGAGSVTSMVWKAQVVADPDPAGSFSQLVMSDNPVDYWRLNEPAGSTIALDYAGAANGVYGNQTTNGLPGAPIVTANGEYGVAMNPSPTTMAQGTVTNMGIVEYTNTMTMVCWVLPTALEPNPSGLFENRSSANSSGYQLAGTTLVTNNVDYNWSGSSSAYNYGDPFGIRTGTWGMAVCEITPLNAVFYVYGTNGLVGIATNNFASQDESFLYGNEIGADPNGGTGRILHGQMNELAIFNYDLSPAQLSALYAAAAGTDPINLTGQPASTTNALGSTSTFTVGADSLQALTYQWYYNTSASYSGATALVNGLQANGTWITNATSAQLTITNLASSSAGYYFVTVANSGASVNSSIASLTVGPSTSPVNVAVSTAGSLVTLSWPASHMGWQLQAQTNGVSVGLSNNWIPVSGSTTTNKWVIPINLTNGCVFYRLVYP